MLSKRLKQVLTYIKPTDRLVDVGCDHGYLAIEAIKKGVKLVQLVDNKKMPLDSARHNLEKVEQKTNVEIIFTLASGLTMTDERINVATICGMGGDLIADIIDESFDIAKSLDLLILQANTKVEHLRLYLMNNKFKIIDESFIKDKNKFYPIIVVKYTETITKISDIEIKYGPIILKKAEVDFIDYLNNQLIHFNTICKSNPKLISEIKEIEEILNNETYRNN